MWEEPKDDLTVRKSKIKGAEGYDIFLSECNHGGRVITVENVKTIKGNETFSWTMKGLNKNTSYKSYVKAYVMKNGRKSYVRTTPTMHACTGGGMSYLTNAKSVTVNKTDIALAKGKTFQIKGSVKKLDENKVLVPESHAPTLRYMTSDSKVATVDSAGKITAKGAGTCYVYAYAHNGVYRKVKVTVK